MEKPIHEETRATFSHSKEYAASIVIKDIEEAKLLGKYISGEKDLDSFFTDFPDRTSDGFDPQIHLSKVGVVNQTTMLATETQAIADYIKNIIEKKDSNKFADTRDTLCYATSDNQKSVYALLEQEADLAIVVGGYNSSNTSHLVELCDEKLSTFHIDGSERILDAENISHFDFQTQSEKQDDFLPKKEQVKILITSGASCPDAVVDRIIQKVLSFYPSTHEIDEVLKSI